MSDGEEDTILGSQGVTGKPCQVWPSGSLFSGNTVVGTVLDLNSKNRC